MTVTPVLAGEVAGALRDGGPVVALETTLVSHGFPGRQGLDVALAAEARVRAAGAVPATIDVTRLPTGPMYRQRIASVLGC